uniref:Uncharacterized protein n=1 Tax=Leersia perrieri TaxID=77586 RepID=A0A0D9X7Y5_9ORYZ
MTRSGIQDRSSIFTRRIVASLRIFSPWPDAEESSSRSDLWTRLAPVLLTVEAWILRKAPPLIRNSLLCGYFGCTKFC